MEEYTLNLWQTIYDKVERVPMAPVEVYRQELDFATYDWAGDGDGLPACVVQRILAFVGSDTTKQWIRHLGIPSKS